MLYRLLIRPLMFLLPPEVAHDVGFSALRFLLGVPGLGPVVRRWLAPSPFDRPVLRVHALGVDFPNPLGIAAGFDKDALGFDPLGDLGFGHVEVGTLTARGQPGNPRPRLFRLPADHGLINRMGFNNMGAAAAAPRLARPRRTLVGVNVGKTKVVAEEDAPEDYAASVRLLAPHADFLVVNVSSPNTPGLRRLQSVERLRPVLEAVRRAADEAAPGRGVPLLVKIAPDLADEDVDAVADLALDLGLSGVVATNTTIRRDGLATPADAVEACGAGGLSGPPLAARSLAVLRRLRARAGDRLVLIASGGIESAADAWERIRAGASLVQVYTAFIYEGPLFAHRCAAELAALARRDGFESITDAVGVDAPPPTALPRRPIAPRVG